MGTRPLPVVIDTSAWIRALLTTSSPPTQVTRAVLRAGIPVFSAETYTELDERLWRPKFDRYVTLEQRKAILRDTRAGTAGDLDAPMVVDPLFTAVEATRQRAGAILADTGRQARLTLSLPMLPETGVIDVNTLMEFADGTNARRGLVRNVSPSPPASPASPRPSRWSAMAKLYRLFKQLQPQTPLLAGDVIQTGTGGVVVQVPDGSLAAGRGAAQIGDRVFVRDGMIEGPAPALPVETTEI